jgi:hypothetical protein
LVKKLVAADQLNSDTFGNSVCIFGDNLVVSSPLADFTNNANAGAAYVFSRSPGGTNWTQVKKFSSPDIFPEDHFASAVAIAQDKLVIGAQLADVSGADAGAAYVYAQNTGGSNNWGQVDRLLPATVGVSDTFGCSVAVSQHTVVVGAYNSLDGAVRPGAVYMFRLKFGNPPQVTAALVDQTVTGLTPLAYTIPANAFTDPDVEDALTLSLNANLGSPGWLNFNATSGLFSGTPGSIEQFHHPRRQRAEREQLARAADANVWCGSSRVNHAHRCGKHRLQTAMHLLARWLAGVGGCGLQHRER